MVNRALVHAKLTDKHLTAGVEVRVGEDVEILSLEGLEEPDPFRLLEKILKPRGDARVMARRIEKLSKPIRALPGEEGWRTIEKPGEIFRALGNPFRKTIFDLLDEGPLRQAELQTAVEKETGLRLDPAKLLHHLKWLEKAGLVARKEIREGRVRMKLVVRKVDVRVQLYERPVAEA
jgi:DNA-binding transcriptional ArsR family regulator